MSTKAPKRVARQAMTRRFSRAALSRRSMRCSIAFTLAWYNARAWTTLRPLGRQRPLNEIEVRAPVPVLDAAQVMVAGLDAHQASALRNVVRRVGRYRDVDGHVAGRRHPGVQ